MNIKMIVGIVGVAAMGLTSCQKDPLKNLTASESRIYITNHDSTADYSSFKTFSVADSVGIIQDQQSAGKDQTSYDMAVISALKAAMISRGFQEVDRSANPDIGINVSRVYNNYTGVINYPSYWDTYGYAYDPLYWGYGGYGYYDPIYYGGGYYDVYQVTEGALTIDALNLKDAKMDNSIHPLWSAMARGTGVFNINNVDTEINAFFSQSPYLTTIQ